MLVGTWACALDSKLSHVIFEEDILFYTPLVHLPVHIFTRIILGKITSVWPNACRSIWRRINLGFYENELFDNYIYKVYLKKMRFLLFFLQNFTQCSSRWQQGDVVFSLGWQGGECWNVDLRIVSKYFSYHYLYRSIP